MAGYYGYSKSNNAVAAEAEGKLPLTRAVKAVAAIAGCTRKVAREALEAIGPCEWHHTSKRYNLTDYYDVDEAVAWLDPLCEELEEARACEGHGAGWLRLGPNEGIQPDTHPWLWIGDHDLREAMTPTWWKIEVAKHKERVAARINRAANFRRWEAALRRIADGD